MTQTGIIQKIDREKVWVAIGENTPAAVPGVAACCTVGATVIEARRKPNQAVQIGDSVQISSHYTKTVAIGAGMVLVPVIIFVAAYSGAQPWFGISSGIGQALLSLAGLAIGMVVPLVYFKFGKPLIDFPTIIS